MDGLSSLVRRYVSGVVRHMWVAIAVAWLICIGGWTVVKFIPNRYEANVRLYVDADAVLTPLLHGIALDDPLAAQIDLLQKTLLSRPNLEKLISKTDLSIQLRQPSDLERMVTLLGSEITVVPQTRNLFTIAYRNNDPRLAYDVVRTIVGIFVEDKAGSSRTDMANASTFLEDQIAGYERKLRDAETQRAQFRAQYLDLLPSDASGVSKLDSARDTVRQLEGQLTDMNRRHDRLTQELSVTPATIVTETDPGTAGIAGGGSTELAAAEAKLRQMRLTLTEQHPDVVAQRELVTALRSAGASGGGVAARPARSRVEPNSVYQQLKVMLVQTDSDAASLSRQVDEARKERDRLEQIARSAPTVQAQSINLNRDYDILRKNYDELLARRESMRIANAADTQADKVKLQIVDPPKIPQVPTSPRRGLLFTMVLLAGLGGGVAAAFGLSQFDASFYTVGDLRALGLTVAGSISLMDGTVRRVGILRAFGVGAALLTVLLLCGIYGGLMLLGTRIA